LEIRQKPSEIARVGDAFNAMADALADRERDLRAAKEKAEQAMAQITTVFERTTDSVITVDRDWRITYVNGHAKLHIAKGRNLIGMDLWETVPHGVENEMSRQFAAAMSEQRSASFEMFWRQYNTWYGVNAFPSPQGLVIFFRDITEHKHALEARRLAEEQLQQSQKMETVGQLTGGVAHDFNNLLTVIFGNLELIEEAAEDSSSIGQLATAAQQACDRGAKLTEQLLAFSRQQRLRPEVIYADHLVREFQGLIRRAVGEACEIRLITDKDLWPCDVDPAMLETTLLNLALNGRDAMPNGGVLEITTRNVTLGEGAVAGLAPGPYVSLSVKDSGCGMSPATRERAFEPFFTTKEVGKGTGLGLSMVYGFVKQSGGHVIIDSTADVGTEVTLYLPKATANSGIKAEDAEAQLSPVGSARVLLVEDDEQVLQITAAMLTKLGHRVFCARNGVRAIQMLESNEEFDLLFTDVVMPQGMSGVELAREARRIRNDIKILLTSGYPRELSALKEFPIINKPFRRAELARCLRSLL
jgi:PAS domain S-box-containing protein